MQWYLNRIVAMSEAAGQLSEDDDGNHGNHGDSVFLPANSHYEDVSKRVPPPSVDSF